MKINYEDKEEREQIIEEQRAEGMYLIEDAILKDEKYLVFAEEPLDSEDKEEDIEQRIEELEGLLAAQLGGAE